MRTLLSLVVASLGVLSACADAPPPKPTMPAVVRIPWPLRRHAAPAARPEASPAEPSAVAAEPLVVPPASAPATSASAPPPISTAPSAQSTLLPLTGPLRAPQFHNPMPGGVFAGYLGDTGLDLAGSPRTIHAIAAATVDYAEKGHTRWTGPKDSPFCVRLRLDQPVAWKGRKITHVYYAHLSAVAFDQPESTASKRHVAAGEPLGTSGMARGVPHLHLGLLLDGEVEQDDWTYILREGEVRAALGGYGNGESLPKG